MCLLCAGASANALAVIFCGSDACPMAAKPKQDCCEKQPAQNDSCCCNLESAPDALNVQPVAIPNAIDTVQIAPAEPIVVPAPQAIVALAERIPFQSDHSPPIAHSLPDSERAPPAR